MVTSLIAPASSATLDDNLPRQHLKLDNTIYNYNGRSYGVGSSIGLQDNEIGRTSFVRNYYYQETGYQTNVACQYNHSTAWNLRPSN